MEVDLLQYEKELYNEGIELIAGVDEVGRGPLYGPVVTAAVILKKGYFLEGLNDSKKLTPRQRDKFYDIIIRDAIAIGIGEVSNERIDEINIYEATTGPTNGPLPTSSTPPIKVIPFAYNSFSYFNKSTSISLSYQK